MNLQLEMSTADVSSQLNEKTEQSLLDTKAMTKSDISIIEKQQVFEKTIISITTYELIQIAEDPCDTDDAQVPR